MVLGKGDGGVGGVGGEEWKFREWQDCWDCRDRDGSRTLALGLLMAARGTKSHD